LTSTPRYTFNIRVHPCFLYVYKACIFIWDIRGKTEKYEYALRSNHIITHEKNNDYIMIHNHQGILKNKIKLVYRPKHILSSFDNEDFCVCDSIKKLCISFRLDNVYNLQKFELIEYNDVQPVRLYRNKKSVLNS